MSPKMDMGIVYENNLDTDKFARMFNNKAQSYKSRSRGEGASFY